MRGLIYFYTCLISTFIIAQPKLLFDKENHNFGEIKEEGGHAEHIFSFVNEGDQPVKIVNVKASCGCTTPGWTKEEVMPGDSGFIKARYNPRNRPGNFRKSLRITTTPNIGSKTLYISGNVKPKPKSPEEELPVSADDLRLENRSLNLGKITTEEKVEKMFDVYNAGNAPISLVYEKMEVPGHVELVLDPAELKSKERGVLKVIYDPVKKGDLGFISDQFTLRTDSMASNENEFHIVTTIEEFFPNTSVEELDRAPKLKISERVYDFGQAKMGEIVTASIELTNQGKEKLNFRKIKSNCSCVTYEMKSKNIKQGKSKVLNILFDTTDRNGNQYKTITLFSNDPLAPTQMITIKGTVKK